MPAGLEFGQDLPLRQHQLLGQIAEDRPVDPFGQHGEAVRIVLEQLSVDRQRLLRAVVIQPRDHKHDLVGPGHGGRLAQCQRVGSDDILGPQAALIQDRRLQQREIHKPVGLFHNRTPSGKPLIVLLPGARAVRRQPYRQYQDLRAFQLGPFISGLAECGPHPRCVETIVEDRDIPPLEAVLFGDVIEIDKAADIMCRNKALHQPVRSQQPVENTLETDPRRLLDTSRLRLCGSGRGLVDGDAADPELRLRALLECTRRLHSDHRHAGKCQQG